MLKRSLYLTVLLIAILQGQSLDRPRLPTGAAALEVAPSEFKLKYHFLAVGKQVYQCENGQWSSNSTPDATLYDMDSNLKIRHSAGPSWTTIDGRSTIEGRWVECDSLSCARQSVNRLVEARRGQVQPNRGIQ